MSDKRHKSFLTAKARRTRNPLVWTIDDDVELRLKTSATVDEVADLLTAMQEDPPEGVKGMEAVKWRTTHHVAIIRKWFVPEDQGAWDSIAKDVDIQTLMDMANDLIAEYTGANPTKPPSSPDGSSETGESSTDGAVPAESTPST